MRQFYTLAPFLREHAHSKGTDCYMNAHLQSLGEPSIFKCIKVEKRNTNFHRAVT